MKKKIAETYLKMPSKGFRVGFYVGTGSDKKFDCFPEIDEAAFETEDEAWQWADGFAVKAPPQYTRIHVVGPGTFMPTKKSGLNTKRLPAVPSIAGVNPAKAVPPFPGNVNPTGTGPINPPIPTERKV